jgi:2-keto-3-deoxy-L-rhamnonate aldolase RhmA
MNDRLGELLNENKALFGVICRDVTHTDLELMAQTGYHVVFIDLEHGPQSMTEAIGLARTAKHLGMVPLVRIVELSRTHVQTALDGGFQVVTLPDVKDSAEAARFVELGKYPPLGRRGVSTTSAGTNFSLGDDPKQTLRDANDATHLMVMFESDEAYEDREAILAVDGIDMAIVGLTDWSTSLGLGVEEAASRLGPKVDRILQDVSAAGKTASMIGATPEEARRYADLGVRVLFVGVDVSMRRGMLVDRLGPIRAAVQ